MSYRNNFSLKGAIRLETLINKLFENNEGLPLDSFELIQSSSMKN